MIGFLYAVVACISTIIGGILPISTEIKKIEVRYLIGFAAGVMVSAA